MHRKQRCSQYIEELICQPLSTATATKCLPKTLECGGKQQPSPDATSSGTPSHLAVECGKSSRHSWHLMQLARTLLVYGFGTYHVPDADAT